MCLSVGFSKTQKAANVPRIGRLAGIGLLRDELKPGPIAVELDTQTPDEREERWKARNTWRKGRGEKKGQRVREHRGAKQPIL